MKATLPSLRLTRAALEKIASWIDEKIGSDDAYSSFEISGRQFDVETITSKDLRRVDWPDKTSRAYFYKKSKTRRIVVYISGHGRSVEVNGNDSTWVHGASAEFRALVEPFRSHNGFLSSPWVVISAAFVVWAGVSGPVLAALVALGADMGRGEPVRAVFVYGVSIYVFIVAQAAWWVPAYLFPAVEFHVSEAVPTHIRVRKYVGAFAAALVIGVISSLIAAVIFAVA